MYRIIAMVGDAEASAHLQSAVGKGSRLVFVRSANDLLRHTRHQPADAIVLDIEHGRSAAVQVAVRELLARFSGIRVYAICTFEPRHVHTLVRNHYFWVNDVIFLRTESPTMTRSLLLQPSGRASADLEVRRLISPWAPVWMQPYVDWSLTHDGTRRPDVASLAKVGNVRRETLARKWKSLGVCPPHQFISWMVVLRATARMTECSMSLSAAAFDLGLSSGWALANQFARRTHLAPSDALREGIVKLADNAVSEIFHSHRVLGDRFGRSAGTSAQQ